MGRLYIIILMLGCSVVGYSQINPDSLIKYDLDFDVENGEYLYHNFHLYDKEEVIVLFEELIFEELNNLRDSLGLHLVLKDTGYAITESKDHSDSMMVNNSIFHSKFGGKHPYIQSEVVCYNFISNKTYREKAKGIINQFYTSEDGHKEIILSSFYKSVGIGVSINDGGGIFVTIMFCSDNHPDWDGHTTDDFLWANQEYIDSLFSDNKKKKRKRK